MWVNVKFVSIIPIGTFSITRQIRGAKEKNVILKAQLSIRAMDSRIDIS